MKVEQKGEKYGRTDRRMDEKQTYEIRKNSGTQVYGWWGCKRSTLQRVSIFVFV